MPEARTREAPLTLFEPEVVRGIAARLRVTWLLQRFDERRVWAAFMFVNGFVTIGLLSLVGLATGTPFVFPSLGPTAFLFFFDPRAPSASPHHALIGHAIGIACGYASLVLLDLQHSGSALALGVSGPRVLAAALSLAATGALMILFKAAHPPAGATTLIISLGAIVRPRDLVIIEVALALLVLQAIVINRLAGLDYPLWRPRTPGRVPR
ncbi:MAG TPA: HPP family protein [Myxococcales bacterium]|nr:HPP family protein [Myxococcales bacterium]